VSKNSEYPSKHSWSLKWT